MTERFIPRFHNPCVHAVGASTAARTARSPGRRQTSPPALGRRGRAADASDRARSGHPLNVTPRGGRARRLPGRRKYKLFHQIADRLHDVLPPRYPIDVRLGYVREGLMGQCWCEPFRLRIRVSSRLPQEVAIEVLIHEWAHALVWRGEQDLKRLQNVAPHEQKRIDHGVKWGRAYAKVYCAVLFDIVPQLRRESRRAQRLKQQGLHS